MKLEQLRTFLAVLEHSSLSLAADALGVSKATVSFHIDALEEASDCRLLQRGTGTIRPTSQGLLLQGYARHMLALERDARARLRRATAEPSGHLVIAASTIVAAHLLPDLLASFRRTCPQVSVVVDVSDSRTALDALRAQCCELALIGAPAKNRRFHSERFAQDEIVLVGPPEGVRQIPNADALANMPLVLRERGSGTGSAVAELLVTANLERPDVITVGSTEAARRMVLAGLGYTFISRHAVQSDLKSQRLTVVALPGTPVVRGCHVVRLRAHAPSPVAQALYELVVASAGQLQTEA